MKLRIKQHSTDSTIMVDYSRIKEIFSFRYKMQYKLLEQTDKDVYLFIDTNTCVKPGEIRISAMLDELSIEYVSFKIKETEKKIFGVMTSMFRKKTPKMSKRVYIAKIDKDNYSEKLFMQSLSTYDIGLGFGPSMSMVELKEEYNEDVFDTFFKKEFYEEFVYDSIMFKIFRSTIDVEDNAVQIEQEIQN